MLENELNSSIKHDNQIDHTSLDLSRPGKLLTRSRVVMGDFCIKTALISSSDTGPAGPPDGVEPVFKDAAVPFAGTLFSEAGSSLTDFCS